MVPRMRFELALSLLLLLALVPSICAQRRIKIGFVSGPDSSGREVSDKFWSFCRPPTSPLQLEPISYRLPRWGAREIANAACDAASQGAQGLIVLCPSRLVPTAASFASRLRMPLVTPTGRGGGLHLSLQPDTTAAAAALLEQDPDSSSFAFLYDTETGADQLGGLLSPRRMADGFWRVHGLNDSLSFLYSTPGHVTRVVMALASQKLAAEITASTDKPVDGILLGTSTSNVMGSMGRSTLTKFSLSSEGGIAKQDLENRWRTLEATSTRTGDNKDMPESAVLSHDAIRTMYSILEYLGPEFTESNPNPDCSNYTTELKLPHLDMKAISGLGVTGPLQFGEYGQRTGYTLDVIEINSYGQRKIGKWSEVSGLQLTANWGRQKAAPERHDPPVNVLTRSTMPRDAPYAGPEAAPQKGDPPIRVTSVLERPFLHKGAGGELEGYVVDLLKEMRRVTDREWRLKLVADGGYGRRTAEGKWNGMIGELVDNVADVAMGPLTKTIDRGTAVLFGKTFMTVGLSVLLQRPPVDQWTTSLGPLTPLRVWSGWQWALLALLSVLSAALCYAAARFVGVPDRVRALESKGKDGLSPCGALWFTCGALMMRDTGIYPRSLTHRLWSASWWFLCLILVVFYISSLTAEVVRDRTTITTTYSTRTSQQVLEDMLRKGSPMIGTIRSGSTPSFFRNSKVGLYQEYGQFIDGRPDILTPSYKEGVRRVREGKGEYAFLMESLSAEYNANQAPCDTLISAGYLATRSYAPAIRMENTDLRDVVDEAILGLMEDGVLRQLYERWWHNFTDYCQDPNNDILPRVYSSSLTLHEMAGIFTFLILGAIIAIAAALVENYLASRRSSILE